MQSHSSRRKQTGNASDAGIRIFLPPIFLSKIKQNNPLTNVVNGLHDLQRRGVEPRTRRCEHARALPDNELNEWKFWEFRVHAPSGRLSANRFISPDQMDEAYLRRG